MKTPKSEETKRKMKKARKEYIEKNPHFQDGKKNPMFGKDSSKATKKGWEKRLIKDPLSGSKNRKKGWENRKKILKKYMKYKVRMQKKDGKFEKNEKI